MTWVILIIAGMLEAVWAVALAASDGFKKRRPTAVFFVALTLSMVGLAWAMTDLPTGTAYAVWVGIGATLTVLWGFVAKKERPTTTRVLLLMLLVGSVVGLKVVG